MFTLVYFVLTVLAAASMVKSVAIPRNTPPSGWNSNVLECYEDYHTRYLALSCQTKHNTKFFDDCCHPLKQDESLEQNRQPYCRPGNNTSSTPATLSSSPPPVDLAQPASPTPEPTPSSDGDDDEDDDEDEYCEEDSGYSSSTPTPTPTPPQSPNPTLTPTPTPSPSPNPAEPSSSTNNPEPSPATSGGSDIHQGGVATWFTQNGVAGACGTVHSDSDFIAALDSRAYGDTSVQSEYCGKTIRVTWQDKYVDVVVADACPTCDNAASVDLSVAAFEALAPQSVGELKDISWSVI